MISLSEKDKAFLLHIELAVTDYFAVCDKHGIFVDCDIPGAVPEYRMGSGDISFYTVANRKGIVTIEREALDVGANWDFDWTDFGPMGEPSTYYKLEFALDGSVMALYACAGGGSTFQRRLLWKGIIPGHV